MVTRYLGGHGIQGAGIGVFTAYILYIIFPKTK